MGLTSSSSSIPATGKLCLHLGHRSLRSWEKSGKGWAGLRLQAPSLSLDLRQRGPLSQGVSQSLGCWPKARSQAPEILEASGF